MQQRHALRVLRLLKPPHSVLFSLLLLLLLLAVPGGAGEGASTNSAQASPCVPNRISLIVRTGSVGSASNTATILNRALLEQAAAQDAPPNALALSSRSLLELAERLEALGRPGMAERALLAARRMVQGVAGEDEGKELAQVGEESSWIRGVGNKGASLSSSYWGATGASERARK